MTLNVEAWKKDEIEHVEENLELMIALNDLDPETVLNSVRREAKIEKANEEGHGGRPSKVKGHKNELLKIINEAHKTDASDEVIVEELKTRIQDAVQDLSHTTELQLRRSLEQELNIGFKKPFHSFDDDDFEDLLLLKKRQVE